MRNSGEHHVSAKEWVRSPDFMSGYREAWRNQPPDYSRFTAISEATRYELGRHVAIYMRAAGLAKMRPAPPSVAVLKRMARDTGLPRIIGINA